MTKTIWKRKIALQSYRKTINEKVVLWLERVPCHQNTSKNEIENENRIIYTEFNISLKKLLVILFKIPWQFCSRRMTWKASSAWPNLALRSDWFLISVFITRESRVARATVIYIWNYQGVKPTRNINYQGVKPTRNKFISVNSIIIKLSKDEVSIIYLVGGKVSWPTPAISSRRADSRRWSRYIAWKADARTNVFIVVRLKRTPWILRWWCIPALQSILYKIWIKSFSMYTFFQIGFSQKLPRNSDEF